MSDSATGRADRRHGERRKAERRRGGRSGYVAFLGLHRPVKVLVYLLIALTLIQVYHQAEFLISKILGVLLLFVFAAIVATLLTPVVDRLQTVSWLKRRGLAVLALNLLIMTGLIVFVALLIPPVISQGVAFGEQSPKLFTKLHELVAGIEAGLTQRGIPVHLATPGGLESLISPAASSAVQILGNTVATIVNLILIVVISLYLEMQGRELLAALRRVFPSQEQLFDFSVVAAGTTLVSYVRGQFIFAAIMAVFTTVALALIGVHFALVIGVVTFFLELVPLIGAPIAMALAIVVASLQGPGVLGFTTVATVAGHFVGAYTIGLKVIGRATRLHPLVAMAALLLGAELGGILGALFAIPLAGIMNVYMGAIYLARPGEETFALPETEASEEVTLDHLPRLGDEIKEATDDG